MSTFAQSHARLSHLLVLLIIGAARAFLLRSSDPSLIAAHHHRLPSEKHLTLRPSSSIQITKDDQVETTQDDGSVLATRRRWLQTAAVAGALHASSAHAAPPIAVIAEELGYFPVTNREGETVFVSKSVQRESSEQAVRLAQMLRDKKVVMAGTYWCPHTSRQKELFGREAWNMIAYAECAPRGYKANPSYCLAKQVDGYPTWVFPNGKRVSGERPLSVLAKEVGFVGFREDLEQNIPPLGGAACSLANQKK